MRVVSWNIRSGGGRRAPAILEQLEAWAPDIACLCEFRATPPSAQIGEGLRRSGLEYQEATVGPESSAANGLLVASRFPLRLLDIAGAPTEPRRWLAADVLPLGLALCLVHIPNMVTGRKQPFMRAVSSVLEAWDGRPAMLVGDTNCGWPGLDEETSVFDQKTADWLDSIEALGWRDAYRLLRPGERFFTWYSPNAGNGFRLDQAFVNEPLAQRLVSLEYFWGRTTANERREALSDHAALIVDLDI